MGGGRGWNLRSERMGGEKMGELEERGGRAELEDREEGRGEEVGSRGREVRTYVKGKRG